MAREVLVVLATGAGGMALGLRVSVHVLRVQQLLLLLLQWVVKVVMSRATVLRLLVAGGLSVVGARSAASAGAWAVGKSGEGEGMLTSP